MAQLSLSATLRTRKGKEAAKKLRNIQQIPAVFYGPDAAPVPIAVKTAELQALLKKTTRDSAVISLHMTSEAGETRNATVMIKELQVEPVRGNYLHADFYEISMDREITTDIAVNLVGEPVGVTRGGVLQYIRREVNVACLPDKLMDRLDVDVSGLDIGDAVHIEDIVFPEGITPTQEGHLTVAVVAAPTAAEEPGEEVEEAEAAEAEKEPDDAAGEESVEE